MKKLLVLTLILAFMTVMAYAEDKGKSCAETCKVKCAAAKAAAGQTTGTESKDAQAGCATKAAGEAAATVETSAKASGEAATAVETTAKDPHAGCGAKATGEVMKTDEAPAAVINTKDASVTTTSIAPKIAETCPDTKDQAALETFHKAMSPMHMALEDGKYAELRKGYPELAKASVGVKDYNCPMSDKCSPECKKGFEGKRGELLKAVEELGVACNGNDDKKLESSFMTMHEAYVGFASMCKPAKPAEEKK